MTESGRSRRGPQASVGIAVVDHEGWVVRADETFQTLLQRVEPLEGTAAETLFATPRGLAVAAIRATLADRKPRLFTSRTAGPLVVAMRSIPRLRTGKLTRFLMHAEAAGAWPNANMRPPHDAAQSSGRQLATFAHDFNNLLSIIASSAESGRERAVHDLALLQDLDAIGAAAQRGAVLLRKLVALDGDGEGTPAPQAVDLNAAVQALSPLLRRVLDARIALNVVAGTPPLAWLDPVGLDQVILNLAVNARDAMPAGGRLTLSTGCLDGDATLAVADTGEGIPSDLLPTVLRPGVTTKRPGCGQGLGLASVFEIVRQSRGGLMIESAPGEGTVVRLHFPAEGALAAARRVVLLVEDEAPVRRLAATALSRDGWEVISAESVTSALAAAAPRLVDVALVVTDLSLPDGDGLALIQHLRTRRPGLPAVLASGYPASALAQEERGLRILAKPYGLDSLVRACAAAITGTAGVS